MLSRENESLQSLTSTLSVCRGQAQNQELGYGPNGKKSSANPEKCYALENVYTHQVTASKDFQNSASVLDEHEHNGL